MVKDHPVRGKPLPPIHGLLFSVSSMGTFICTIPHQGLEDCLYEKERNGSTMRDQSDDPSLHE